MPLINLFKDYGADADFAKLHRLIQEAAHEQRQNERLTQEEERASALAARDALAREVAERPLVVRPPDGSTLSVEASDAGSSEGGWEDFGNLEQGIPRDADLDRAAREPTPEPLTLDNVGMFLDTDVDALRTDEGIHIPTWDDEEDEDDDEESGARVDASEVPLETSEPANHSVSPLIQIRNMNTVDDIHRGTPAWEAGYTMGLRDMLVRSEESYNNALFKKHYFFLYALIIWLMLMAGDLCDDRPTSIEIANESVHHHVHHAVQEALIESMRSGGSHAVDP